MLQNQPPLLYVESKVISSLIRLLSRSGFVLTKTMLVLLAQHYNGSSGQIIRTFPGQSASINHISLFLIVTRELLFGCLKIHFFLTVYHTKKTKALHAYLWYSKCWEAGVKRRKWKKIGIGGMEKQIAILYSLFYSVLISSYHAYKFS